MTKSPVKYNLLRAQPRHDEHLDIDHLIRRRPHRSVEIVTLAVILRVITAVCLIGVLG